MNRLSKGFIIFLFVAIFFPLKVCAKELKFVQITDSHFTTTTQDYSERDVEGAQKALEASIADINTIPKVDFVVFTGDNIDKANLKDLKAFIKIANRLNVPYYMVIGNHEVFKSQDLDKKEYMKIVNKYSKNCRPNAANYVFEKKGIIFIVVDGAKEIIPGPAGYYKQSTLKWLDKQLYKYKNNNVVILQHFPIVAPYYNRTHTTYNTKDYEEVLKKHSNVIAIVSGHYHGNGEKMQDGIYHISTPALVASPHDFKVIEMEFKMNSKPQIYTQLRHAE